MTYHLYPHGVPDYSGSIAMEDRQKFSAQVKSMQYDPLLELASLMVQGTPVFYSHHPKCSYLRSRKFEDCDCCRGQSHEL